MYAVCLVVVLPILLSCSQSTVEQSSTYSKTEEAAYEAARNAARELSAAFVDRDIAISARRSIQTKATDAHVELLLAQKAFNDADKAYDEARRLSKGAKSIHDETYKTYKRADAARWNARNKLVAAKKNAEKIKRSLQRQAAKAEAAERRVEEARETVYLAAALGAFRHVADEAMAKMEYKPVPQSVAQHDQ